MPQVIVDDEGVGVPFLSVKKDHYSSFPQGLNDDAHILLPMRRGDADDTQLGKIMRVIRATADCSHCPLCTIFGLVSAEVFMGSFGILLGLARFELPCERHLQEIMIAFGVAQLVQGISSFALLCRTSRKRRFVYENFFTALLVVFGFMRIVGLLPGCAIAFGHRHYKCDKDLQREMQWYMVVNIILMASSFCYAMLLIHPSFSPTLEEYKRRVSIEIGRRTPGSMVQMTTRSPPDSKRASGLAGP
uniref:Transmembrane protein n=1 Tax=Lotharella oceanica TaxID=641309 RepID=A0A7S2THH7_9EUKA